MSKPTLEQEWMTKAANLMAAAFDAAIIEQLDKEADPSYVIEELTNEEVTDCLNALAKETDDIDVIPRLIVSPTMSTQFNKVLIKL